MQKITAHFLKSFKPGDKQVRHRKHNLQVITNPSGKVSLAFYFNAEGKQVTIKMGAFKGIPSQDFVAEMQAEYSRLYQGLLNASSSGLKAITPDDRLVTGAEAFLEKEFDRQEKQPDPSVDFGQLPAGYAEQLQREKESKTFRFACLQYLEDYLLTHPEGSESSLLKHLVNGYGRAKGLKDLEPQAIKAHQIQAILDAQKKDMAYTAHHTKKCANRLWRWMRRRGIVETYVTSDLEAKEPPPRNRVFSEQEIGVLLRGCHPYYRAIALNPLRLVEHCRVHWDAIDEGMNATVMVKGGRDHVQPLTEAYIACGTTTREQGGWLLTGRHGHTQLRSTSLSDIGRHRGIECGVPDHHSHDWRSTFATWHERQKTPYEVVDACLSHQKTGIRKVYGLYQYLDEKREALQAWADYIGGLK